MNCLFINRILAGLLCSLHFLCFNFLHAQHGVTTPSGRLNGVVMDAATNTPIPGATLKINSKNIATTKSDGRFSVPMGVGPDTMLISHSQYQTDTLLLTAKMVAPLTLFLQRNITEMKTVLVSTGYQQLSKEKMVGVATVIDQRQLEQQSGSNVLARLNHITPGLIFNANKQDAVGNANPITIRGLSTINGPVQPLIVLNNFIYEGSIDNINPADVESITVLKDAAATSLWGARAGNGVIVITTKKTGFNNPTSITLSSRQIIGRKPDLFYPATMRSADFIDVEQALFNRGYFNSAIDNTTEQPPLSPAVEVFLAGREGRISKEDSVRRIQALAGFDSRNDLLRYFYKPSITQQYNLQVGGGQQDINWLLSGAIDNAKGFLGDQVNKLNLHATSSYKPYKNLLVTTNLYFTGTKTMNGAAPSTILYGRNIPYLRFADASGNALPINRYRAGYVDTAGAGLLQDWNWYPLTDYQHDRTTGKLQDLILSIDLRYQLLRSLSINLSYQYQQQTSNTKRLADPESFYTRDLINTFSQIDYVNHTISYQIPRGSVLDATTSSINAQNFRAQFNYDKTITDHQLSGIAGTELRERIGKGGSQRFYGYTEDPLTFSNVDYTAFYPTFINGYWQQIPGSPNIAPTTNNRFVSFYGNFSYGYKQRYLVYGSFRKDASNIFGLSTNDQWNPLWSSGVKWELHKESFYKSERLNLLSLRTSFGTSGNVDVNKTPLPVSSAGLYDFVTRYPVMVINNPNNPLLKWEQLKQWNLGIDLGVFNNRVTGSIDYYIKTGTDLYGSTPFDYTAFPRTNIVEKNVASMKGHGMEVQLRSLNSNKAVVWRSQLLFNYTMAKTRNYYQQGDYPAAALVAAGNMITPVPGYPLYAIAAYSWRGLDALGDPQGSYKGQLSKDYSLLTGLSLEEGIKEGTVVFKGAATPKFYGALINEWSYKGFFASVNVSYNLGYYFRKTPFSSEALIYRGIGSADYYKRWQQPGDEKYTDVPAFVFTDYPSFDSRDNFYRYSEVNVLKADHVRLEYVNLGYSFQKPVSGLRELQLTFNAANLGILWRANQEHLDPDYPSQSPPGATFTAGLRIIF